MSTIEPPPKPEQREPAVDIRTLAYLLREIDLKLETEFKAQRRAGIVLFFGGMFMLPIALVDSQSPLLAAAAIITAYGFTKLF